jgi:hypothetical protein
MQIKTAQAIWNVVRYTTTYVSDVPIVSAYTNPQSLQNQLRFTSVRFASAAVLGPAGNRNLQFSSSLIMEELREDRESNEPLSHECTAECIHAPQHQTHAPIAPAPVAQAPIALGPSQQQIGMGYSAVQQPVHAPHGHGCQCPLCMPHMFYQGIDAPMNASKYY